MRDTKLKQVRRAEVPQLVEIHPRPAERRPHRIPVVMKAVFAELTAAPGHEQPRDVDPGHDLKQSIARRRRQDHYPLFSVLRKLDFARPVEIPSDDDLVLANVAALKSEELSGPQPDICRENHD